MKLAHCFMLTLTFGYAEAQLGLFDYGVMDLFNPLAGFNEGPCIERRPRRRQQVKQSHAPVTTFRQLQPSYPDVNVPHNPHVNQKVNEPPPANDPFLGGFDFLLNMFNHMPHQLNGQFMVDPKTTRNDPEQAQQSQNLFRAKGRSHIPTTIDYSQLTNTELQKLLEMVASQKGHAERSRPPDVPVYKPHFLRDPFNVRDKALSQADHMYADLAQKLKQLSTSGHFRASHNKPGGTPFRQLGVVPGGIALVRKKRALRKILVRLKRQIPFDFMGLFGSGTPTMAFCGCIQRSEMEPDYIVQSPRKYKCGPGLVCACNSGGVH